MSISRRPWLTPAAGGAFYCMILKAPDDIGCKVYDANGVELKYLVWCDTETGKVRELAKKEDGEFVFDDEGIRIVEKTYPAPLRWERTTP